MSELPCVSTFSGRFCQLTLALFVSLANPAAAQENRPPEQSQTPAQPPTASSNLLDGLSKLFKSPVDMLSPSKPEAPPNSDGVQQAPPAPAAAVNPTPATSEPPATSRLLPGVATGREVCPRTASGAPDCQAGADKLCQSKGYKGGKGLNTDSAFSCSARQARAEGRKPCGTEHFVTSAFCQ